MNSSCVQLCGAVDSSSATSHSYYKSRCAAGILLVVFYFPPGEGSSFLSFKKGDLISLENEDDGETVMNSGWCSGLCTRTGQRGDFPAECVYILPAVTKPSGDVLVSCLCC